MDTQTIPLLVRREIEAMSSVPIIRAFIDEFGEEKALEVAGRVIGGQARQAGKMLAKALGKNDLVSFVKATEIWSQNGALEFDVIESTPSNFSMNVTRCRYAETYEKLGCRDLGAVLSCGRDFTYVEGFNPKVKLTRTQTIMEGKDHCDFRFVLQE